MTRVISIKPLSSRHHTPAYGRYDVVIEVNGIAHRLEYTCELREENGLHIQAVTWKPEDSLLADHDAVDLSVVTGITDTVVQYHTNRDVSLPRIIAP